MLLKYIFIFVFIYSSHVHHRQFRGRREYWLRCTCLLDKVNKRVSFQASYEDSVEPTWKWYKASLRAAQESVFFGNLLLVPNNKLTSVCSTSWATAWVLPLLRDLPVGVTILSSRWPWSHSGLILQGLLSNVACYSSHIMYSISQLGWCSQLTWFTLSVGGKSEQRAPCQWDTATFLYFWAFCYSL